MLIETFDTSWWVGWFFPCMWTASWNFVLGTGSSTCISTIGQSETKMLFLLYFLSKNSKLWWNLHARLTVYLEEGWFCIFIIKTLTFVICFILRSVYCTLSDQRVLQFWNIPTACYFTKVYNMLENIMIIND